MHKPAFDVLDPNAKPPHGGWVWMYNIWRKRYQWGRIYY